jgi:hypothetical protein
VEATGGSNERDEQVIIRTQIDVESVITHTQIKDEPVVTQTQTDNELVITQIQIDDEQVVASNNEPAISPSLMSAVPATTPTDGSQGSHSTSDRTAPWEASFQALTAHEQAMHKLYSKYGTECDDRLQRPSFGLCSRYLQNLCPACFGGTIFGKTEVQYVVQVLCLAIALQLPFSRGGDIHVRIDGNKHHSHAKSGGDNTPLLPMHFFVDKEDVDQTGNHLQAARGVSKTQFVSREPEKALDQCEHSFHAARGDKETKTSQMFDDTGIIVMVC